MAASPTTLIGNLTADPNLTFTAAGAARLTFSIAVNHVWRDADGEQQKKTSYFDCVAWRETAERAADVLEKGLGVIVVGRLEQRSWEDKDTGDKRSKIEVVVDDIGANVRSIETITRRQYEQNGNGNGNGSKPAPRRAAPPKRQTVPDIDEEAF
jgi:single-strand DNA-binding protein